MSTRYTKEELEEYFFEALAMFNDALESDITSENVVLDFFTPAILQFSVICLSVRTSIKFNRFFLKCRFACCGFFHY